MRSRRMIALALAGMWALFALPACAGAPGNSTPSVPSITSIPPSVMPTPGEEGPPTLAPVAAFQPVDKLDPAVHQALSAFSLDLFRRVATRDEGKNVFLSPLSVWLALGMTANGAAGDTAKGIRQALHAANIEPETLNRNNAGLMGILTSADSKVRIAIANSIWTKDNFASKVNPAFLDANRKYYGAEVRSLDFSSSKAADTINQWVSENTGGKIRNMIQPPISEDAVMYLINAVYFNAPWRQAFDAKLTCDGVFTAADGTQINAKYLFREEGNLGFADGAVSAVRIPYASGRLEFVAIQPHEQSLALYLQALTPEKLETLTTRCRSAHMSLLLPKFRVEYALDLKDMLADMGMDIAFQPLKADFTTLSEKYGKELFISKVQHKSFVEVNEEGTEAAAATSVEIKSAGEPMSLEFNKPFLYLIRDTKTGAILFLGVMESPVE